MTELLSPTGQTIAAVVVAVFVGLIFARAVWIAIKKLLRWQAVRRAKAEMDARMKAEFEETMTAEQCEEMQKQLWPGDRR